MLEGCTDWHVATDLKHFIFLTEKALTTKRPDIVIWSVKAKKVFVIEENFDWAHHVSWKNMNICENNVTEMAG